MFYRRAPRFIPDTFKASSPVSTALARNVLYPRVAWHEQHVM
ncbi:hypothetical protein ALC56_02608 [Trachymyrmex septentrionalis]|uniref:Uncharacterized protein n=1 Tax=Trachymyrmex septentrionalis TaxID=34720 RepID=A0A195FQV0_9HYME|nr:hypothetical protein ALC56_02608 [Trachymyrmex septentrionalis]